MPINRLALTAEIIRRLDTRGWPNRADSGWSDYDVEIYGSRWSTLQLTTVTEDIGPRLHRLRCRLRPRWSLAARVGWCAVAGLELLLLGLVARAHPWLWLLLLSLPALAWLMRRQQRRLQSTVAVFLAEIAKESRLVRSEFAEHEPGHAVRVVSDRRPERSRPAAV